MLSEADAEPMKTTIAAPPSALAWKVSGPPAAIAGGVSSIRLNVKTAPLDPPESVAVHVALAERVPPLSGVEASTVRLAGTQTTSTGLPVLSVAVPVGVAETLLQRHSLVVCETPLTEIVGGVVSDAVANPVPISSTATRATVMLATRFISCSFVMADRLLRSAPATEGRARHPDQAASKFAARGGAPPHARLAIAAHSME